MEDVAVPPITRVCTGSNERLGDLVRDLTPFVLRKGVDEWPAIRKWSWDYLKSHVGQQTIAVFPQFDPTYPGLVSEGPKVEIRFSDYIDRIVAGTAGELGYVTQHPVLSALPRLLLDIAIPKVVPPSLLLEINLWLAFPGKVTPLHFDFYHTALVQVIGRKKVSLAAPSEYEKLDFFTVGSGSERRSRLPLSLRDPGELALSEIELGPGDVLFIPAFWAHETRALESSVGVSFWWRAEMATVLGCPGLSVAFAEEATVREPWRLLRLFEVRSESDLAHTFEVLFATGRIDEVRLLVRGVLQELDYWLEQAPEARPGTPALTVLSNFAQAELPSALARLSRTLV